MLGACTTCMGMCGNGARDWYEEKYPEVAVTAPVGRSVGSFRVCRGGSWAYGAAFCRSAYRNRPDPSRSFSFNGFRVALSSSGIPK